MARKLATDQIQRLVDLSLAALDRGNSNVGAASLVPEMRATTTSRRRADVECLP